MYLLVYRVAPKCRPSDSRQTDKLQPTPEERYNTEYIPERKRKSKIDVPFCFLAHYLRYMFDLALEETFRDP